MSEIIIDSYIKLLKLEFNQLESDEEKERVLEKLKDFMFELELIPMLESS
jgi:hypothetical protein